ncbi:MAG: hypothetical protein HYW27_01240, partial [Candidatus Aenigmarchaeota archaeon]|nr:hypothetical protein [Candidatus Aenigmarchaeota archaeon]
MPSNIDLLKGKIRMYIEATGDAGIKNIGLDREDDLRRARRALAVFYHPDRARTGDLRTVLGRISGDVNNILDDMIFYNTNKHTPINQLKVEDRARLNEISRDVTKEDIKSGTEETKKMLDEQKRLRSRKLTKKELEEEIEEERIVQEVRRLRKAPENPQHSAIGPFDEKGRKYKSEPFEGQTSGRRTLVTRPFGEGNKKHESEPMGEKGRRFASEPMGEKGKRYESEPMGEKGKRYRSEPMWEPEEKPPEKPKEEKK